jgi:hypothetical protein
MNGAVLIGPGDRCPPDHLDVRRLVGIVADEDVRHAKYWCSLGSQCSLIPTWSIGSKYPGYDYERANQGQYTYQDYSKPSGKAPVIYRGDEPPLLSWRRKDGGSVSFSKG